MARQVTTVAQLAPGRFVFGVGLGGEDRHELELCGVDPTTRGRRLDECLTIVRALLAGETVDFAGRIFQIEQAKILPTPPAPVPIVIGGRSEAAFRRTARLGDGWLGLFVSADRYRESVAEVEKLASRRRPRRASTGTTACISGAASARRRICSPTRWSRCTSTPFERFERYAPYGTPEAIADSVRPYIDGGARHVNLAPVAATPEEAIDAAAEVAELLRAR